MDARGEMRRYGWTVRVARNDVLLAAAVTALAALDIALNSGIQPKWAAAVTEIPGALALVGRRRLPLATVIAVSAAFTAEALLGVPSDQPVVPLLALVVVLYSVAAHELRFRALLGLGAAILAGAVVSSVHRGGVAVKVGNFAFGLTLIGATWAVGRVVRSRTQRGDRLEEERLVAVADERARIARELHDVVAHSVSVMVVQAGAAEEVLSRHPERALEAVRAVQDTGRQALVEMSRLLGLLRDDHAELGLAPQPGIGTVDALVAQVREAGLPVELLVEGNPGHVPLGIDLSVYRVIQEALTNALKHAGDARAEVRLRYGGDALEVEIVDDGRGSANGHVGGHGLAGMRERVAVFGGEFAAGPRPEGGFSVRARLPLQESAT
jgi:signal transduction histidine kinase